MTALAQWIWTPEEEGPHYWRFRRAFTLEDGVEKLRLAVTADTAYVAFLDGRRLGAGPARGWPEEWFYDTFELGALPPGRHVLALLVRHWPAGTFQYLAAPGGVWAELSWESGRLATGSEWRVAAADGYAAGVPRISCQQGWEEQLDARLEDPEWLSPGFDDSGWRCARAAPEAERPLAPRPIPALTETLRRPRLCRVERVTAPEHILALELREAFPPERREADVCRGEFLLGMELHSETVQEIRLWEHSFLAGIQWQLNGEPLRFDRAMPHRVDGGMAVARLRPGRNWLLGATPRLYHGTTVSLALWGGTGVRPADEWQVAGPFAAREERPEQEQFLENFYLTPPYLDAGTPAAAATAARREELLETGGFGAADPVRHLPNRFMAGTAMLAETSAGEACFELEDEALVLPPQDGPVRILYDCGDETVGDIGWEIDAPEGCVVDMLGFEFIQKDGRINLSEGMNNSLRYICGEGPRRFRSVQGRGLRYFYLTLRGFDRPVRLGGVRLTERLYPQAGRGSFTCSDPRLEAMWRISARTLACCSLDTYVDCPSYEQAFWVGDARNEALVDLAVNGDPRLSEFCWFLAARGLERFPLVPSQLPSGWSNLIPAWSMLWMSWAAEHWLATGDAGFARRALPWLARQCRNIAALCNADGLIEIHAWNMFDWARMDTPTTGVVTHQNCLAVRALNDIAHMAGRLGEAVQAEEWRLQAGRLKSAINRRLWDPGRQAYVDSIHVDGSVSAVISQQTQVAALLAGVPDSEEKTLRVRQLSRQPEPGMVTAASPFFMTFLLEDLGATGEIDALAGLLRDYWGRQVEAGATTFWECYFEGQERLTRSHCHAWSATPAWFLSRYILGVRPLEAGFRRAEWRPHLRIDRAEGRVPTPFGPIEASWRHEDGTVRLRLRHPPEIEVVTVLPEGIPSEWQEVPAARRHSQRNTAMP